MNILTIITDKPTSNNQTCKLPYKPELNDSNDTTTGEMWFCYNNQCPTEKNQSAKCASGKYLS